MTYLVSEIAREATAIIEGVLRGNKPPVLTDEFFVADHQATWEKVARSGVLLLGASGTRGGADATVADLTAIAAAWGPSKTDFPLPSEPSRQI